MRVLDLFSGIGGFSLGLERAGFQTVAFCEIEPYCQAVLRKHWPDIPIYDDVRELTGERLRADGITADVVTGGFPCQDISVAGRRSGLEGERSGLWTELCRLIGEVRPQYAIVENVAGLLAGPSEQRGGWFGRVLGDLAEIGFDCEWHCIPASAVGAPHRRDRVWIVGYASGEASGWNSRTILRPQAQERGEGQSNGHLPDGPWPPSGNGRKTDVADTNGNNGHGRRGPLQMGWGWRASKIAQNGDTARTQWRIEPDVGRVAHGVSSRVDRLRALGNAVVPQIPEMIGRAIMEAEQC